MIVIVERSTGAPNHETLAPVSDPARGALIRAVLRSCGHDELLSGNIDVQTFWASVHPHPAHRIEVRPWETEYALIQICATCGHARARRHRGPNRRARPWGRLGVGSDLDAGMITFRPDDMHRPLVNSRLVRCRTIAKSTG